MMKFQQPKNNYTDTNSEDDPELEHLKKELQFFFEEMESEGPLQNYSNLQVISQQRSFIDSENECDVDDSIISE